MPQNPDNRHPIDDWQPWLERHGPALLLLARQYVGNFQEAQDAMQEGFIKFWKRREKARDPAAYLFSCVRSAAIDLARARSTQHRHEQAHSLPVGLLQSSMELDERRRQVDEALLKLPSEQREVLVMKIWGELTFEQIACTVGIPPNTAAARYRYALERLQIHLSREVICD